MDERPEAVFTPTDIVREDMYSSREELETRVSDALAEPGRQIILYGDTGVGKTSLAEHLCSKFRYPIVRTEFGPTLEEMLRDAMAQVGAAEPADRSTAHNESIEGGGGLGTFLSARARSGRSTTERTTLTLRTLAHRMAEALEAAGKSVLFLDNYEDALKAEPDQKRAATRQLEQLIKVLSDRKPGDRSRIKLVIAGIPSAAESLVSADESVHRRFVQIHVRRMSHDELQRILERGGAKLGMTFDPDAARLIVHYSDGYPYYTHLLALHAVRAARRRRSAVVTPTDFQAGLDGAISDCLLELQRSYERAVETTGTVRARRSVLEGIARHGDTEIPFSAIRAEFIREHPTYSGKPVNFLSNAIGKLKDDGVLADRGRAKSTSNKYRFRNPLMRNYIRMLMRRKDPQLVLWEPNPAVSSTASVSYIATPNR